MTEAQNKAFHKIRTYFYKKHPTMKGLYLNVGSVKNPSVLLEFNHLIQPRRLRNGTKPEPELINDFIQFPVPENLINDFKIALTKK
jgi:hypothetical protein